MTKASWGLLRGERRHWRRSHRPWKRCCSARAGSSGWMNWSRASAPPSRSIARSCSRTCGRPTVGCGWIWSGSGTPTGIRQIFEDPGNHLHPYAPDFSRRIEVYGKGEPIVGLVSDLPEPERTVLAAEDVVSVASVPILVGSEWWGFLGFDDCSEGRVWDEVDLEALWTTAQALGAMLQRDLDEETRRFSEDQFRSMVEEGPAVVYIDGPDEGASSIYISPQIERVLGYSPDEWYADPDLWRKVLHPDDRSRALAENERHNETGDPFAHGVPHVPQGRARGVGARRGHDGPGRPRGAPVLPRRDDGHLRRASAPTRTSRSSPTTTNSPACRAARCSRSC